MKVAVIGCLHGMLDEMYNQILQHERDNNTTIDLVLVCGDCQTIRHEDDLKCLAVPHKFLKLGDFHQYYSGQKKIPRLTIFVGGNHEASNYLMSLPYGGWVCDNFYYLGYASVVRYKGVRIAGVSGIYNYHSASRARFERLPLKQEDTLRSVYHTRKIDVFRLHLLATRTELTDPIDVFLSHDWPSEIYNYGDVKQLLRFKPFFKKDIDSGRLGSPLTKPLLHALKPRRWFAAHLHCKFFARVQHDKQTGRCTEFLSLNKIENKRNFMDVLDIESTREHDPADNDLYYDAEWLTILRKTINLEECTRGSTTCPDYDSQIGQTFIPTEEDIKETIRVMSKTGGLKIKHNFEMSEPVIYNRPDGTDPSIDKYRKQYFPNPQQTELYNRLELESLKDAIQWVD